MGSLERGGRSEEGGSSSLSPSFLFPPSSFLSKSSWHRIDQLGQSLRYAIRLLSRTPAFTVPAIISLALGIAVNTTMFSVVNSLLLKPLVDSGGDDLVRIGRSVGGDRSFRSLSLEDLTYLREHASSFSALTGHQLETVTLTGRDDPELASVEFVSGNYFPVLRVTPALGRAFAGVDDRAPEEGPIVVISDRFWRRRFGGDSAIIGRTVQLSNRTFTVVGVAPPGFVGTFPGVNIDLWLPTGTWGVVRPRSDRLSVLVIGRLKPSASITTASAELEILARRIAAEDPTRDRDRTFVVAIARGAHPAIAEASRAFLALLMAIVGVVLLIACANVASLLLARTTARRAELAARLAVGASRGQLVIQLLVESFVLACAGAGSGLLLTVWAVRSLNASSLIPGPTGTPVFLDLQLDARVLLFTAALTVLTTLAFGLMPALQATRVDLVTALKDLPSASGRQRSRLRSALMVAQVAVSAVLMIAAVLLFRSLRNSTTLDLGFEPDQVVVVSFNLETVGYDRSRAAAFYDELLRRVRTMPRVHDAALADFAPLGDRGNRIAVALPGTTRPSGQTEVTLPYNGVTEGYLRTIRQPLVRGRDLTTGDRSSAPLVVIVNEAMARRFWPGQDAIGKRIRIVGETDDREVVGIAKDARWISFGGEIGPFVFMPLPDSYGRFLTLHVRTAAHPPEVLASIRRLAREIDANVAPSSARTMRETMAFRLIPTRIAQTVLGVAGVIALLLASGGLYGLVYYTLQQRMKEIGIRVALGASRRRVFQVIVGGAVRLTTIGVLMGVLTAAAATRLLSAMLYGLSPTDPLTFGGIAALLVLVTLGAGYVAARKGLNVDPMVVLRQE